MISTPKDTGANDRLIMIALGVVLIALGVAAAFWLWPSDEAPRMERVVQEITVFQPPPPPPPLTPEEKIEEEKEIPLPTENPQVKDDVQKPSETPSDAPATPSNQAAGLDRPADAGSDSFHLGAGKGGGLFGRGGGNGDGGWGASVSAHITRALQLDPRTRSAQGAIRVQVDIDSSGRFNSARLLSSTGDPALDAAIRDVLSHLSPMSKGRPAAVDSSTQLSIKMKRIGG
jgi:TonB family protein